MCPNQRLRDINKKDCSMLDKTLLIIDDDEKTQRMMSYLFMSKGFNVEVAASGTQGLDILNNIKTDVIILDLMMPEMNGFEFCKQVKENNLLKEIPVIALSACPVNDHEEQILSLGACDFFPKPFDFAKIVARTIEVIETTNPSNKSKSRDV